MIGIVLKLKLVEVHLIWSTYDPFVSIAISPCKLITCSYGCLKKDMLSRWIMLYLKKKGTEVVNAKQ